MILTARPSSPPRPAPPHDLGALRQMLEQGWRIEPPVLARLSWAQQRTGEQSYHIILARATQRSLIVLPESSTVLQFLSEQHIPIL